MRRRRLGSGLRLALLLVLVAGAGTAPAGGRTLRHVRVVLDLSRSMRTNDPDRLATLSTVLLHDLVAPNPSLGDSFEVIPFDPQWTWPDGQPPPTSTGPRIRAEQDRRESFAREVTRLPYDGRNTFYFPGLKAAVDDLARTGGRPEEIKTIVLVTDGLPIASRRDVEAQLIRQDLVPRMAAAGIRFYILAFGPEAAGHEDYLRSLRNSAAGGAAASGEVFVDPQGGNLLATMLQIFARSFGYSPDNPQSLPVSALDLDAQTTPEKVAVVVFAKRHAPLPRLALTPPAGGRTNRQEGVKSAAEVGASFSLLWVLAPSPGGYGLDTDAVPGTVAVLRPIRLRLEIRPFPPHTQTERTMARTRFPLRVLVRNPLGSAGAPPPVDLSIRPLGERRTSAEGPTFSWLGDWSSPPPGSGTVTPEGRVYDIAPEFLENRESPRQMYPGNLEVRARSGEAEVGALADDHAHPVEVYPLLSIAPQPLGAYASPHALSRHEEGCTRFTLVVRAGELPHPDLPSYPVQAGLAADPATLDRELHEASFTLDGLPLEPADRPANPAGQWRKGRTLTRGELLGEHQVCVRTGRPKAGDPTAPLALPLTFTLREDPYDDFHVVEPFTLKVLVDPPGPFERWRLVLLSGAALLALLAALWYLRDRPALPADLGCAVGREEGTAPLVSGPLGEPSLAGRLLGLAAERPVIAPGEDRLLGRVRGADAELYRFRPARGVQVEPVPGGERVAVAEGAVTLAVHRTYRLRTPAGAYLLRLEYR